MKETLYKLRSKLIPLYGKGESEAIIRLIFHFLKGWTLTDMLIHQEEELSPFIKSEIDKILLRLQNYEPIQYITGEARFHGMDLKIRPGVLIPRQETEELVDLIIDENKERSDLQVLDVCSGSGCIAISLARNLPFSKVYALDFSENAIDVAAQNAAELKTKIELIKADIFAWSPKVMFDIIVSNPPYVMDKEALTMDRNVLDYEPHEALFVRDEAPLLFYERIAEIAKISLSKKGKIYFEINPLVADDLKKVMMERGFQNVELIRDSFGKYRFLSAGL